MFRTASIFLLLLAMPCHVYAQNQTEVEEKAEIKGLGQCGLVTRYASSQINDTCLQEALNVYLDEDAGISRRGGFAKYNTSALPNTKSVRGVWPFRATDGTDYIVVLSSQSIFQSNGQGSFTAIPGLDSLSASQDMDCSQCLGKLWCVNGSDTMFSWDGTSTGTISGAPTCSAVDCFRNRIALANCSGTLSQLRLSGELDGADYSIPATAVSTSPATISVGGVNDGNKLNGILGVYQDVLVLGKQDSLWGFYGFDRRDFTVREISREVGLVDNRSAREKQGSLYWLSKRGIEKMTGPSITRISDPIRNLIDTIIVAGGNTRSGIDTSQANFTAGNLTASGAGAPMSATINPGNVVVSTWGVETSISSDSWVMTDISTGDISSSFFDNFEDGDFSSNPTWTEEFGKFGMSGNRIKTTSVDTLAFSSIRVPQSISTGTWSFTFNSTDTFRFSFIFYSTTTSAYTTQSIINGNDTLSVLIFDAGSSCRVFGQKATSAAYWGSYIGGDICKDGKNHTIRITRNNNSFITVSMDNNVLFSSSVSVGAGINTLAGIGTLWYSGARSAVTFGDFYFPGFYENQISKPYNIGFSTTIMGPYSVSMTSSSVSSITFKTQLSASELSGYTTLATQNNGYKITPDGKKYIKHAVIVSPPESLPVSSLSTIEMSAATTGYFISQCQNPGTPITSWGLFQCNQQLNSGTMTYYVSTGTSCNQVTRTTATWTEQTNNTVISVATAAYVAYRVLFNVDSATQTPTLNDCTINWNEGTSRPSVSAEVYRDRYYLAYTSGTSGTVANDHLAVLDSRDQWVLHDAPNCSSLGLYRRKLYCGDSSASGQVYLMDTGQSDDGSDFTSSIKTKDFDLGNPFQKKLLKRMYYDLAGLPDQSYSISLTPSYTVDASTDTFSLPSIGLNEDYSRFIAAKVPADLEKNTTGRWFSFGLSHTGSQGPWKLFGLRFVFSRLSED